MRRAARVDWNQAQIVLALRKAGAFVQHLHTVGSGCPDLLVSWRGQVLLMEVKDGRLPPSARKLTPDEQAWHDAWTGPPVYLITCVADAMDALGVK